MVASAITRPPANFSGGENEDADLTKEEEEASQGEEEEATAAEGVKSHMPADFDLILPIIIS